MILVAVSVPKSSSLRPLIIQDQEHTKQSTTTLITEESTRTLENSARKRRRAQNKMISKKLTKRSLPPSKRTLMDLKMKTKRNK
jgi:regulator of replication initiation timing